VRLLACLARWGYRSSNSGLLEASHLVWGCYEATCFVSQFVSRYAVGHGSEGAANANSYRNIA